MVTRGLYYAAAATTAIAGILHLTIMPKQASKEQNSWEARIYYQSQKRSLWKEEQLSKEYI
jgi:phosphoribosyl-AMP cyclohydrolase